MPEVTCVGVVVADVIVRPVDAWPQPGRLSLVDHIELHGGGLAYTTAVTLAKLGVSSAVVGRVGGDPLGTYLADGLRAHGVEVHLRQDAESRTAATVVTVTSGGERSFLHLLGANGRLVAQDVPDELLARSRVLHLGGFFILPALDGPPAAELFRRAKAAGCRTSLDTAWDPQGRWMSALAPCLPYVDLLFGNQEELTSVAGVRDPGAIGAALRARGVGVVAVKMGEAGAYVDGGSWRGHVPAFAVPAVDTTGAGDAFCGGFLAGYLAGWDLETSTRFANAVGGLCVTAVGGTTGVRSTEETLRFLETAPVRRPASNDRGG